MKEEISTIQEKLVEIISDNPIDFVRDFMVARGANREKDAIEDELQLAKWIEGAPINVKNEFLDEFNENDYPSLRVCSNCGCFMDEGYMLDCQYACSDACGIALYKGNEKQMREDIGDGSGDYFWTQWY